MATTPAYKYLDNVGLAQVWAAVARDFVAKESGKGLSTEDFTSALKSKLDLIAEGAQVNVIESVKVNNAAVEVVDKTVNITIPTGALASKDKVAETDLTDELAAKINGKVDAVEGKGLSTNDYDNAAVAEVAKIASKANASDVYTKTETDEAIKVATTAVYKAKGSTAFASLPALDSEGIAAGHMYNVTDAFTTTADFVEGAGVSYPAGTNVVVIDTAADGAETPVYKWDCMAGVYDFSGFVLKSDIVALTTEEIANICKLPIE